VIFLAILFPVYLCKNKDNLDNNQNNIYVMNQLSESDKSRLISFIEESELDYEVYENVVTKFNATSCDGIKFFFYTFNEQYIIVKYDKNKDNENPASQAYEYFYFQNLSQVLEQLSFYDNSIPKSYWSNIADTCEIGFDKDNYNESWYEEFMKDDFWTTEDCDSYKTIVYSNPNYKPELKSPYNTLHEVSEINELVYTKVDKLYFEIHPISCRKKNESYLLKLSCSNDDKFRDYINYTVNTKKGLKMLLETIFKSLEPFKVKS